MKLSARNILKGTVKNVTPGAVNTEVDGAGARRRRGGVHHHETVGGESGPPGRSDGLRGSQGQQRDDRRRLTFDRDGRLTAGAAVLLPD